MRRPLPASRDAPRRKRALVLLVPFALSIPPTMVAATSSLSRSIACSAGSNLETTLTSRACGPVCGDGLCVYRTHSPSSCSMDCVPTVADARTLAVEWLNDGPAAMAVTSTASNEDVTSTIVVREPVRRIDSQLEVPTNVSNFSLCGPRTAPLMGFSLSDASRSTFEKLQVLNLAYVNISDWKTLPSMRELQNLSLVGVGLTGWPLPASVPKLTHVTLDDNDLVGIVDTVKALPSTLISLSLRSTGLTKIPGAVANATSLQKLYLDGIKFQENGTVNLSGSLWTISMRGCGLRRIPDEITAMTGLEELNLSHNPEIKISNDTREIPMTVRNLQLAACGLTTFPTVLSNRQLTTLDLSFNALRDDDRVLSAKLATLTKLESLDLAATNRTLVPSTIASLSKLSSLSLASNAIAVVDATALPSTLEHLNVAHNTNPLALSLPAALASRLLSLNVSHCGLTSLNVTTEPLRKLQTLDASGNALSSDAAAALPATLRFLNLSSNRLTALPDLLFQLKSLRKLDLRGNPIPRGSVASLSSTQVAFLDNLPAFYVDAAVFQSVNCSAGAAPTTFSFGYSVCSESNDRGVGGSAPEADARAAAAARARMNRNLYIIAATIGTALVVVTLASLAMRRRGNRRDAKKRRLMDADGAWPTELASDREMTDAEWRALQMWSFWDDEDVLRLRIPWDLVRDRQVIGSGQYSVLWLARVAAQPVFLKALQPTAHRHRVGDGEGSVAAVASLIREIQLLRALRHAHIVRLVGVTWMNAPTDVQVAIEDMANGDLRGYLELTQPPAPPSRWRGEGGFSLRVALQIADAMVFLHRCGVAHNDLRSRNVVLDDDCNAKLTGFGRHVFVEPVRDGGDVNDDDSGNKYMADAVANAVKATAKRDTDVPPPRVDNAFLLDAGRWMAPEVLRRHLRGRRQQHERRRGRGAMFTATTATSAASAAADVYAFGVLLLELDCFEMPFARVDTEDDLMEDDWNDDDDELDNSFRAGQRHRAAPGPHDANDLRFSSMPSYHNSLLGGAPPHLTFATTDVAGKPTAAVPDEAEEDEDEEEKEEKDGLAPTGATMSAGEEKCELALLRRLADGVASHAELSPTCPASVGDVILQCLQLRAERRPSMRAVRDALRTIASQRRRSSTATSTATAAVSTGPRSISGSQRSLLHAMSGGERDVGAGGAAGGVAVATQTVEEEQAFADGSSSADSDATTAFFVMQPSPARLRVSPP